MKTVFLLLTNLLTTISAADWVKNQHGTYYLLPAEVSGAYTILIERDFGVNQKNDGQNYGKEIITKVDCLVHKYALVAARRYKNGQLDKEINYESKLGLPRLLRQLDPTTLNEYKTAGICP